MARYYAVLTGDIVSSSRLSPEGLDAVQQCLNGCARRLNKLEKDLVVGKIDFFRGDAWQMLLNEPTFALRVALFLRAELKVLEGRDTRIAIGMGTVERISKRRISQSSGEAFTRSGEALDRQKRRDRLTIALPDSIRAVNTWLPVVLRLCDALVKRWTPRQAQAVSGMLRNLTQVEIAAQHRPPVSQQAVAKALSTADWYAVESTIEQFEALIPFRVVNSREQNHDMLS